MSSEGWFRLAFALMLLSNLALSAHFRRRAHRASGRIQRSAEPKWLIALRIACVLPVLLSIVAYLVHPPTIAWARAPLPESVRWVGVVLGFGLLPANAWLLSAIGANISETVLLKEDHELVEHGPYRWVRHPLYACGILLVTALGLTASSWALLSLAVLFALLIRLVVVPREEAQLVERFGERYEAYRRRTGALLPRLR